MEASRREILKRAAELAAVIPLLSTPVTAQPAPPATATVGLTRFRPTPSKVSKTPADLVAARLMLPYSKSVPLKAGALPVYKYAPGAGIYERVGLTKYMGATGERQEIGLVTEAIAAWLMGESPDNMMAQAEAHGEDPIHALVDGRFIDVIKKPLATFDYRAVDHANWKPYFDITDPSLVKPDIGHYPPLSYVPYLASGDQYYLEELQAAATYHLCGGPPDYAQGKGIIYPWQQRSFAWAFRDVIAAYIATLEAEKSGPVAAPLLPSSYWKQIIDNNIAFYTERYIKNGSPLVKEMGFLACDDLRYIAPWQQDYLSTVLGWAIWTGKVPQLRPLYDFQIRQAVKRATGPLRSAAIQYDFTAGAGNTWAETLSKNGRAATADGHYPASVGGNGDYLGFLRGALQVAVMNSVPGAQDALTYADAEAKKFGYISKRWGIAA